MLREITIIPVLNGYICRVGCQSVVFQQRGQMLSEIEKYLIDPEAVEKSYVRDAVNKMPDRPQANEPTCAPMGGGSVANSLR
jgi:hypothetical protein